MGLRMENSNMGGSLENSIFRKGRIAKKTIYRGKLPKKVAWTVCRWGGGGGVQQIRGGGVFEGQF